jgi:catecholate siderophore receptor
LIQINRNVFEGYSKDSFAQNQTDIVARFASGRFEHALVAGFELGRENPEPVYISNVGLPTTSLTNPQPQPYSVAQSFPRLSARTRADSLGVFMLDTIKWGEHWQIMAGARWDRFDSEYRSTAFSATGAVTATTHLDHVDEAPSYRAALLYKPVAAGTIYLSYGDSFNPSAEGIESMVSSGRGFAQANLKLDPEESRTYELGTKWEVLGGGLLVSSSVFRIEKSNARVPDPLVPGFNTLGGEQRVDGFEMELAGQLTAAWHVRAGYAYLDSEVVRSAPGGPLLGAPLTVAPKHSASLWTQYALPFGLEIGLGAVHISDRLAQNTATAYLTAEGYTTVDAMAKYQVSTNTALQLNISNLNDEYYFDQLHPFHVVPGAGRTALLSLQLRY